MSHPTSPVVKSFYFSNWGDLFGYRVAYLLLKVVARIPFITPTIVTLTGFLVYLWGAISLWYQYPFHLVLASLCLVFGFILDDLDGQLARYTNKTSIIGDYLDKVLDVLKLFIITASLGYAVYIQTQTIVPVFLGFIACFFFMFRYYIKLETVFSQISIDPDYLKKSLIRKNELEIKYNQLTAAWNKNMWGKVKTFWLKNRIIFWVDEAEFALFTAISAICNRLDLALWLLAVSQVLIATWRFFERAYQVRYNPQKLLEPMRK